MALDRRRFDAAHIDGSIDFGSFEELAPQLPPATEIVVYCTDQACAATRIRASQSAERGFRNVSRFAGGLAEWTSEGLPIVSTMAAA